VNEEKKRPNAVVVATNALKAASKVVTRVAKRKKFVVSPEVLEERLASCYTCKTHFRDSDKVCTECGCFVHVKAQLATEECPIKRWLSVDSNHSVRAANAVRRGIVTGKDLLDCELALRELLPPTSQLAAKFNEYHTASEDKGKCAGCFKRRYYRMFEVGLAHDMEHMDSNTIKQVHDTLPDKTYISLQRPVRWASILELPPTST
jgi:hypothetical protein